MTNVLHHDTPRRSQHTTPGTKGLQMLTLTKKLVREDGGQDLAEYGIALAVIGTVAGAAAVAISTDVGTLWSKAQSIIHAA